MYILQTVSVSALVPKCFFISETESDSDCVIIIIMVTKIQVPAPNT